MFVLKLSFFFVFLSTINSFELNTLLNSEQNTALVGFTYKDFKAFDLWECFEKCLGEGVCQSINFNLLSSLCQFNKDIKKFHPKKPSDRYLGVYMENPRRGKIKILS